MKGIFVAVAAMCLGACASQPNHSVTMNAAGAEAQGDAVTSIAQPARRTERVYLDDYERVLIQAPRRDRQAIVLGANKDRR